MPNRYTTERDRCNQQRNYLKENAEKLWKENYLTSLFVAKHFFLSLLFAFCVSFTVCFAELFFNRVARLCSVKFSRSSTSIQSDTSASPQLLQIIWPETKIRLDYPNPVRIIFIKSNVWIHGCAGLNQNNKQKFRLCGTNNFWAETRTEWSRQISQRSTFLPKKRLDWWLSTILIPAPWIRLFVFVLRGRCWFFLLNFPINIQNVEVVDVFAVGGGTGHTKWEVELETIRVRYKHGFFSVLPSLARLWRKREANGRPMESLEGESFLFRWHIRWAARQMSLRSANQCDLFCSHLNHHSLFADVNCRWNGAAQRWFVGFNSNFN